MKRSKLNLPIKLIITIIIISFSILFIIGGLVRFLTTSDYFEIKEIVASRGDKVGLSYLKGKNIFSIDLRKLSQYLARGYPNYRKIRLIRILPNRIYIDFTKRKAIALVNLYRYLAVDEEGVFFDIPEQLETLDLPIILGLETKIFGPKAGKKYNIKELTLALNIIKELKLNRDSKDYKIKRIDVASLSNASFFLTGIEGLQIKINEDNIKDKINLLAGLLIQTKDELPNIKYFDLRFKEPVIKFKVPNEELR